MGFSPFEKTSSVSIWIHTDGYVYIKLFGDYDFLNIMERELPKLKGIEDYHYQNQCDKPDEVSQKSWDKREKIWDEITGGSTYTTMLSLQMVPDYMLETWNYEFSVKVREAQKNIINNKQTV